MAQNSTDMQPMERERSASSVQMERMRDVIRDAHDRSSTFEGFANLLNAQSIDVTRDDDGGIAFAERAENPMMQTLSSSTEITAATLRSEFGLVVDDLPTARPSAIGSESRESREIEVNAVEHADPIRNVPSNTLAEMSNDDVARDIAQDISQDQRGPASQEKLRMIRELSARNAMLRGQLGNGQAVTDGALDMDGSTPDLNDGIKSHDGADTDSTTVRIEREQNGTDVPMSQMSRDEYARAIFSDPTVNVRIEQERERMSSPQLASDSGVASRERVHDYSDDMQPVR